MGRDDTEEFEAIPGGGSRSGQRFIHSKPKEGGAERLAQGTLALMVGGRVRIAMRGNPGRTEQGVLELLVTRAGGMLSADRLAGTAGDRGYAGVGGQVCCAWEGGCISNGQEDGGCGLGPDSGPRDQDRAKSQVIEQPFRFVRALGTLGLQILIVRMWAPVGPLRRDPNSDRRENDRRPVGPSSVTQTQIGEAAIPWTCPPARVQPVEAPASTGAVTS